MPESLANSTEQYIINIFIVITRVSVYAINVIFNYFYTFLNFYQYYLTFMYFFHPTTFTPGGTPPDDPALSAG